LLPVIWQWIKTQGNEINKNNSPHSSPSKYRNLLDGSKQTGPVDNMENTTIHTNQGEADFNCSGFGVLANIGYTFGNE
jgi:hypothetical protein